MTIEQAISLISVIVAGLALFNTCYQSHKTQQYDKEKFALDIYANFLALCYKFADKSATEYEKVELFRYSVKLILISDNKLKTSAKKLTDKILNNEDSEELAKMVSEEMKLMRDRLRHLNLK